MLSGAKHLSVRRARCFAPLSMTNYRRSCLLKLIIGGAGINAPPTNYDRPCLVNFIIPTLPDGYSPRNNRCIESRLIQHGPLIGAQYVHLALVDRRPVIVEEATRIPRVSIPGPVGITDALCMQERHQGALPHALQVLAHRWPSELSHE